MDLRDFLHFILIRQPWKLFLPFSTPLAYSCSDVLIEIDSPLRKYCDKHSLGFSVKIRSFQSLCKTQMIEVLIAGYSLPKKFYGHTTWVSKPMANASNNSHRKIEHN